jgi:hypothetical protein
MGQAQIKLQQILGWALKNSSERGTEPIGL